jgi:hypothetical protein
MGDAGRVQWRGGLMMGRAGAVAVLVLMPGHHRPLPRRLRRAV